MRNVSEYLDRQTRGESITPNPNNRVTRKRRALTQTTIAQADGNQDAAYAMAMNTLENYLPRLQEFVLAHSEEPAPDQSKLVCQVYQLRMHDVKDLSEMLDFNPDEAIVHMEQEEDTFEQEYGYMRDEFLGELWGLIEICYHHLCNTKPNKFVDPALVTGLVNTIGAKVSSADLRRAAQNKPAGILGALGSGGTAHYNALRNYFRANPAIAKQVIDGTITDESALPNWRPAPSGTGLDPYNNPLVNKVTDQYASSQIKRYLPYIIIGIVLLVGIVYFASKKHK